MTYRELVERLVKAKVLHPSLVEFPKAPATELSIAGAKRRVGAIDQGLLQFYTEWDGANLDVLRIVSSANLKADRLGLVFANDPSGFVYRITKAGDVSEEDTKGGRVSVVAKDFHDFIFGYVFGPRAAEFAGQDWHEELRNALVAT